MSQQEGALELTTGSALSWKPNASSGQSFGLGQTNGGLYFFPTNSSPGVTLTKAVYDLKITDNGDLSQARDRGGAVKAMLYVDPFLPAAQYIVRCYNGVTGSSTGNCGFTVTRNNFPGDYSVNLGFQVDDRYVSIDPMGGLVNDFSLAGTSVNFLVINVFGTNIDRKFMLFVY